MIKIVNRYHLIHQELQDIKHVQLYGKTMAQAEAEREAERKEREYRIHRARDNRYNASSDDEKYAFDYSDYITESVIYGLAIQVILQMCMFKVEAISSSIKNIVILEVSVVLLHSMLQYFSYISFVNNWTPKRK